MVEDAKIGNEEGKRWGSPSLALKWGAAQSAELGRSSAPRALTWSRVKLGTVLRYQRRVCEPCRKECQAAM